MTINEGETMTTTTIDLMAGSPVEIDTVLLREMSHQERAFFDQELWFDALKHYVGDALNYRYNNRHYLHPGTGERLSRVEVRDHAKQSTNPTVIKAYTGWCEATARWYEATNKMIEINEAYAARQWSRYWLVVSSSGHIHRSMDCSTCNNGKNPTSFVLKPSLSGSTDESAVASLGAALCSHCFPDAPTHHREQVRISKSLTALLLKTGDEAQFDAALLAAKQKDATLCAGSGQPGKLGKNGQYLGCPYCDNVISAWRMNGSTVSKMSRHKPYRRKS